MKQSSFSYRPRWTGKEILFLTRHYNNEGLAYVSKVLHRPLKSVAAKLFQLNLRGWRVSEWTRKEDEYLRSWWKKKNFKEIGKFLSRSQQNVVARSVALGLWKGVKIDQWKASEDRFLAKHYAVTPAHILAAKLKRNINATKLHIYKLGLRKKQRYLWTAEKDRLLRKLHGRLTSKEISKRLGASVAIINLRNKKLHLTNPAPRRYTKQEIDYIRRHFTVLTHKQIAVELGRTEKAIEKIIAKRMK